MKTNQTISKGKKTIIKFIWTRGYSPFIMGGDVNAPVGCDMECTPVKLGRGFNGLTVDTPKGNLIVAEMETGAIVGNSLEQVKEDIQHGNMDIMLQQIQDAKLLLPKARHISAEEFWSRYHK